MSSNGSPARRVVAIGSGKGGVGKSTVTLNVALALAERGDSVGVLDADVYGPNIPLLMNLARYKPAKSWTLWRAGAKRVEPLEQWGMKVMSAGFIVAEGQALTWGANLVSALLDQLVRGVEWGDLDYLLVDLPPGTADILQSLVRMVALAGLVVVVTPQDVAHLDARKALEAARKAEVSVLGGVENMATMRCPHCDGQVDVFHRVREDRSIWSQGVDKLGEIPLDPEMSRAGDTGHPLMLSRPDSPQAAALRTVAWRLASKLGD